MLSFAAMAYFAKSPVLIYPLCALALFMVAFVFVAIRTYAAERASFDAIARLPLEDGPIAPPEVDHG